MLTTTACNNAKPKDKPYKLFDSGGLYLQVMPHGSKLWRFKYYHLKKEKLVSLGSYPAVPLAEARAARDLARKKLSSGVDPSDAKKDEQRKATLASEQTFEAIAREWHALQKKKWSARYADDIMHRLEAGIFPELGRRPVAEISASELLRVIRQIEARGAHEVARKTKEHCGQVFNYAIITDRRADNTNPAFVLNGALEGYKKKHFPALEIKQVLDFLKKVHVNEGRMYPQTIRAVRMLMLTFVRTIELAQAQKSEFDIPRREWIIPAERMKMKRDHLVPLSAQAVEIVETQIATTSNSDWLFPHQFKPRQHMSNGTVLGSIKRLGYSGQMTGHGFRALAMTAIQEQLGYPRHVIDRQLAHARKSQVDAAYDRAEFIVERRKMMQEWADYLDKLLVQAIQPPLRKADQPPLTTR